MRTIKVQGLVIILLIHKVLTADICLHNFILRHKWIDGRERQQFCCKKVTKNCQQGFYVKKCTSDLGKDECTPCPGSTWLVDETNSTNFHDCVPYPCATGSKRINYLPKTGCNLPCICDLEQKYYGYDSCNCKLYEGTCAVGTTLTINGTCLPYIYAEEINDLRPTEGEVNIPIIITPKVHGTNKNNTNQSKNELGVEKWIITVASVLGLIVILAFAVWKLVRYKSCNKSNKGDVENQNIQYKGNRSPSTGTDSGVSLTTSSSASGLQNTAADQQPYSPEQLTPPSSSKSHHPLLEQTEVQKSSPQQIPTQEQTEIPDSSQMLLDSESQSTSLIGTTADKNDSNMKFNISKEQSAFKEQTHASSELGDDVFNGQSQQIRKKVATVPPFSHENEVVDKETDRLLNAAREQIVSPSIGEIIQQNRPISGDFTPSQRPNTQGYIDVRCSFGSRLQMSSFGDVSNE